MTEKELKKSISKINEYYRKMYILKLKIYTFRFMYDPKNNLLTIGYITKDGEKRKIFSQTDEFLKFLEENKLKDEFETKMEEELLKIL